jgi:hypothetical protein
MRHRRPGARGRVAGWLMAGAVLLAPAGGSRVLDRLVDAVSRPLPRVGAPQVHREDRVWVPDRYLPAPRGLVHVPGHWELRLSEREVWVPPLIGCRPASGACVTIPAGVRPAPETRPGL